LLTVTIACFLYGVFQFLRLDFLGAIFMVLILSSLLVRPVNMIGQVFRSPSRLHNFRRGRAFAFSLLIASSIAAVYWLPIPARIIAPAVIQYADATQVVNVVAGKLVHVLDEGTAVQKGTEVARLESKVLELELIARQGELVRQKAKLYGLESRRGSDATISRLVAATEESIGGLILEVNRLQAEVEQLTLKSPIEGVVLSPKVIESRPGYDDLKHWEGTPLKKANIGCRLEPGTIVCQISSRGEQCATAYLSQSQVELVRQGQSSVIKMQQYPAQRLAGKIVDVGLLNDPVLCRDLRQSGLLPGASNQSESLVTDEPIYAVRIPISENKFQTIHGTLGEAYITIDSQSLAKRLLRLFHQTFVVDPTVQGK
jgi:multidrug efflux pump subunit AcrA (membrane-fusion protein)